MIVGQTTPSCIPHIQTQNSNLRVFKVQYIQSITFSDMMTQSQSNCKTEITVPVGRKSEDFKFPLYSH